MFSWWKRRKLQPVDDSEEGILNAGLTFAMEWGEDWMKPIHQRLSAQFPQLSQEDLERFNTSCREAMNYGHQQMYQLAEQRGADNVGRDEFAQIIRAAYPWVNPDNLARLFSQSWYCAWKDGL